MRDWIMTVTPEQMPDAPFELHPGVTVVDSARFLASLQRDASLGPTGPRNKWGSLQADLERLHYLIKGFLPW